MTAKPMPSSVEVERALLGCCIQWPEILDESPCAARDFWRSDHQALFALFQEKRRRGFTIDMVTVPMWVAESSDSQRFGGVDYVVTLPDFAPSKAAWPTYAETIREKAKRRRIVEMAQAIVTSAYDEGAPLDDLIERGRAALVEAQADDDGGSFRMVGEIVREVLDEIEARERGDRWIGYSTGLESLDALTLLCPGDLYVLGARPGMGKSALMVQLCEAVAAKAPVGILSLEMKDRQLVERQLARRANIPSGVLRRGKMSERYWRAALDAADELQALPIAVDDRGGVSFTDMRTAAVRMHRRMGGLGMLAVDYIQLAETETKRGENYATAIGRISRGLKALAKELDCAVLALSQLSRAIENREDKRPHMSDLRESGQIEQDADVIWFLYREGYYNPDCLDPEQCELIQAKGRHEGIGTVALRWAGEVLRFSDMPKLREAI